MTLNVNSNMNWQKGFFVILVSWIMLSSGIISFIPSAIASNENSKNVSPNNKNNFDEKFAKDTFPDWVTDWLLVFYLNKIRSSR